MTNKLHGVAVLLCPLFAMILAGCGDDSGTPSDAGDQADEQDIDVPSESWDDGALACPDHPAPGASCTAIDQLCTYDYYCGGSYCSCEADPPGGGRWNCHWGSLCETYDADADAEADEGLEDGTGEEVTDVPEEADAPEDDGGTAWPGIPCGFGVCDVPAEVCCVSEMPPVTQECRAPGACAAGMAVTCDGPEDCATAGDNCCMPSGAVMSTYCMTGGCPAGQTACHEDLDCPGGQFCCTATMFGYTYKACGATACP